MALDIASLTQLQIAAAAVLLVFSTLATYLDLKERRIPNSLNLLALLAALSLAFLSGALSEAYALFIAAAFVLAYLLFRLGVWAGGDAKFFTALLAFLPLFKTAGIELIVFVFLASSALTLPVLALVHWKKMFSLRNEFLQIALNSIRPSFFGAITSTALYFALALLLSFALPNLVESFIFSLATIFAIAFALKGFAVVSQKILRQKISVSSLKEGDIPAQSVYLHKGKPAYWQPPSPKEVFNSLARRELKEISVPRNEIVSCLRARGVSKQEISKLKEAGVTHLVVKQSIPFAPALALGLLLVAWFA